MLNVAMFTASNCQLLILKLSVDTVDVPVKQEKPNIQG
jgi:hypothetical protein